jgi:sterol desaturase/sphingolipid hydroxylase (fatty acid hydroxylase superfamily)
MQTILEAGQSTLMTLLPLAAGFGVLALLIKRARAFEDLQRARGEVITNLAITFFNAMIIVPLFAGPVAFLRDGVPRIEELLAFWEMLPGAIAVVIAVAMIDFAAYWRHRWEHSRALWPIHATHHADEAMNWLTLRRKHPLGEALSMVIDLLPVLLIGLPIWAIAVAALIRLGLLHSCRCALDAGPARQGSPLACRPPAPSYPR